MPDISMCDGKGCPKKDSCFRYKARPKFIGQAYGEFPRKEDGSCTYYWPVPKEDKQDLDTRD